MSTSLKVKSFDQAGVTFPRSFKQEGTKKILCPVCSSERLKKDEPCLSITFNKENTGKHFAFCHHCKFRFVVVPEGVPDEDPDRLQFNQQPRKYRDPAETYNLDDFDLTDDVVEWFEKRGIPEEILVRYQIKGCFTAFPGSGKGKEPAIMFPFFKDGKLINIQFRNLGDKDKQYKAVKDCQMIYYGIDDVVMDGYVASDTLYIVEGQIDKLTMRVCGFPFVWSVPNGSPFEKEGDPPVKTPRLEFHDDPDIQFVLSRVSKIVFVGDADHQGRRLVNELATRCGINKCYKVTYQNGCKDINDVFRKYGKEGVVSVIEGAHKFPVTGVVRFAQLKDRIITLFEQGPDCGLSTGFDNLDEVFRVGAGRVIAVTGVPESGKSRFLANILIHLARLHGVRSSLFSPESRPFENFAAKMTQIVLGKPFGKPGDDERITLKEVLRTFDWLEEYFTFNDCESRNLEDILAVWESQLMSEGVRYGVLDPFNYITRPPNVDEGSFVLKSLTTVSNWAVKNQFTVFIVVHPKKMEIGKRSGEYPVVQPYDIMGSSHWYNCTDFILSLWRSIQFDMPVQVHVLKAKQEELGTSRKKRLFQYDVKTGIYLPYDGDEDDKFSEDKPERDERDDELSGKALKSVAAEDRQQWADDEVTPRRRRSRAASLA